MHPSRSVRTRGVTKGMMLVGLAGPASNLILASSAALVFRIAGPDSLFGLILVQLCIINVVLALFNLIPAPPLDGSRVVVGFLPREMATNDAIPKYPNYLT